MNSIDPWRHVTPTPEQVEDMARLRASFRVAGEALAKLPGGWYADHARRALEESAMWANKAITHGEP